MTNEEKAKAYAEKELVRAISRPAHPLDHLAPYFDSKDIQQAYLAGAAEALASQWKDPKVELPEDGSHLTLLEHGNDRLIVEVAPWIDGKYQGGYAMSVYFKQISVKAWLPIPPLKGGNT
ncbi:hypothetical protein E4T81_12405 [Barnesiella sp. WM24]|uniref:hypothetical protein n=1 Tax=Barnesiella sp. WM24 TaxID=2558278 RepID=UPI001072D893|nr:hypothetical protein [Barnesiella sp. WM24]TFU92384.1 hypothetical protein E4T81_12405 [Barnesiella sp. WM24]